MPIDTVLRLSLASKQSLSSNLVGLEGAAIPVAARGAVLGHVLPRRMRLLVSLIVVEVYAASFVPLYNLAGEAALNVFVLVSAVAGGLLGVRGGLFVALVGLLLHALPFGVLAAVQPGLIHPAAAGTYVLAVIAIALGFGFMEEWRERLLASQREAHVAAPDLRSAMSRLPLVLFTVDRHGIFTMSEGHGLERLGRRPGEAVGISIFERYATHPEIGASVRRALQGEIVSAKLEIGAAVFDATYAPIRGVSGAVDGVICVAMDLTEQRDARRDLEDASMRDPITGLPNRTGLARRLEVALGSARRETALLVLDLDRFKDVNDSLGHAAGDEVLRVVGERIFAFLGMRHQAARLGGDEFAIVAPDTDERGAAMLARTIGDAIRAPFAVDGHEVFMSASIGIALAPRDGADAATLLRKSEVAMYSAKRGGSDWAVYAPAPDEPNPQTLAMTADLRHAIENNELALAFQPIVDCATGKLQRFEALARWPRRDREVPPSEFVPLAERVGLLTALTDWVVTASVRQLRSWLIAGLDARVTVNLSPRNLLEPDLPRRIASALAAAEVPPERFGLEVTESTIMADPERAARTIAELRELAIPIAIDDFGTGHSSLAYLHRLPISTVKIDKSFVRGIASNDNGRAIVRATIDLAHALDFTVVAEGVEDPETLAIVRDMGCDQAQGYHLARPLQAADALRWLRQRG